MPPRGVSGLFGIVLEGVVRVTVRRVADRRLALHDDVVFVVVHVEARAEGVLDLPNHDRGDLDRVSALVVDLQLLAVQIARSQRDPFLHEERVRPAKAVPSNT